MSAIPFPSNIGWHREADAPRSRARFAAAANDPPTLRRGERVLIRREGAAGRRTVGTDQALHSEVHGDWRRIPWTDVDVGVWDPATAETVLRLWSETGNAQTIRIPAGQEFAAFVAERVSYTQVLRRRIRLAPHAVATVVALRKAGQDALEWRVHVQDDGARKQLGDKMEKQILAQFQALIGS